MPFPLCLVSFFYDPIQISPLKLPWVLQAKERASFLRVVHKYFLLHCHYLLAYLSLTLAFYLPKSRDLVLLILVSPGPCVACGVQGAPELSRKWVWQQENSFYKHTMGLGWKTLPSTGFPIWKFLQWEYCRRLIDYGSVIQPVVVINLENS